MPTRLVTLWCCLAATAAIGGFAAGRLSATTLAPLPIVVPDGAPRVPVITLRRVPGGVEAAVTAAEARFVSGGKTIVALPGTSASISLP